MYSKAQKSTQNWPQIIPDVKHAGGSLGQDQAGVDQVGDGQEDDEDRGGVGPDGLGAEEDIQGGDVEDGPQSRDYGGGQASNIELCLVQHVRQTEGGRGTTVFIFDLI